MNLARVRGTVVATQRSDKVDGANWFCLWRTATRAVQAAGSTLWRWTWWAPTGGSLCC